MDFESCVRKNKICWNKISRMNNNKFEIEMNKFPLLNVLDRDSYSQYQGQPLLWFISNPELPFKPQMEKARPMSALCFGTGDYS